MTDEEWKGLETLAEKMLAYYRIPGCAMAVIPASARARNP